MSKRTFTVSEIAKFLKSQANEANGYAIDLGNGIRAVQMAEHSGLSFTIEKGSVRNGADYHLNDATPDQLKEISEILWAKYEPFVSTIEDDLTPDELKDEVDTAEGLDALVPDALREKPDNPNLEKDELGLTPDSLRAIIKDPGLARRLATGKATVDDLLTPESLKGGE